MPDPDGEMSLSQYGVRCTLANGEDAVITLDAADAPDALAQVEGHKRVFHGAGDTAGRWLASQNPRTIVKIHEARPLADWDLDA